MDETQTDEKELNAAEEVDVDHDRIAYGSKIRRIKTGEELNVSDLDPTLDRVVIGLGWDIKNFEEKPVDLDASVFLLNAQEKTRENEDFVFYNNPKDRQGAVSHEGDSRTGAGAGDDETVQIHLNRLSYEVIKLAFVVSIYDEDAQGFSLSDVRNLTFRLTNPETDHELFRYELEEEDLNLADVTAMVVGYMERIGPKWIFRAVGEPVKNGLGEIAERYDIVVAEHVKG